MRLMEAHLKEVVTRKHCGLSKDLQLVISEGLGKHQESWGHLRQVLFQAFNLTLQEISIKAEMKT
jgi:hypothetical protein